MEAKNQLEATLSKQDLSHAQANVDDSELGVWKAQCNVTRVVANQAKVEAKEIKAQATKEIIRESFLNTMTDLHVAHYHKVAFLVEDT